MTPSSSNASLSPTPPAVEMPTTFTAKRSVKMSVSILWVSRKHCSIRQTVHPGWVDKKLMDQATESGLLKQINKLINQ